MIGSCSVGFVFVSASDKAERVALMDYETSYKRGEQNLGISLSLVASICVLQTLSVVFRAENIKKNNLPVNQIRMKSSF